MNFEQARTNMVERQIRPCDVLDEAVLALFHRLKREDFVPPAYRALAFSDMELPLGEGQTMLEPRLEARFLQELRLQPQDRVLEIGTGSGFMAALLASQAAAVTTLEINPELAAQARANLARAGIANVQVEVADAAQRPFATASFDAIMISGSVPGIPETLLAALAPGGRLAAVVGTKPAMRAQIVSATKDGFHTRTLFETETPPLKNFKHAAFQF